MDLPCADLSNATLPDGRTFEKYKQDHLANLCFLNRKRETVQSQHGGSHSWSDCPMHAAFGYNDINDAPKDDRIFVAAFVALFDGKLLPKPDTK